MGKFYGRPQRFVRHVTDDDYTIEPQRARIIPFWYCDADLAQPSDGDDSTAKGMRLGSKVTRHKVDMTIKPYTIEPQNVYMGVIKLSFHDILSPYVCGKIHRDGSYQDATPTIANVTSYIRIFPEDDADSYTPSFSATDLDVTDLQTVRLDDFFNHFVPNLKKVTVFDQQPLLSNRWMKVPSKVKRINQYTFYGLWVFNDAVRGGTPADTQIDLNVKQYFEEYAL